MVGKFALIIGNSTYQDTNLGKLNAPANDVRALADTLMDPAIGAFNEVKTLLDRPFSVLQPEIISFFDRRHPEDTLLFYFSGHGLLDEGGRLFLATIETKSNQPRALSIPATLISDEMSISRSRKQVLVFDCCHSGAFLAENAKGVQPIRPVHTEEIFRGSGRTVLTATDTTEYAFEGSDARSVFTRALVEGLRTGEADQDNDQLVSVDEWYDYAFNYVHLENPRQTPMKANYGMRGKLYIANVPLARLGKAQVYVDVAASHSKKRYKTWLVHPYGRGDFFTISDAIAAANPGDRIEVYAGLYEECLLIEKPLEIVGLGNLGDVVVQMGENKVVSFDALGGRIENITFVQLGGPYHCIDIRRGSLELEGCDISSIGSSAAIGIHGKAKPALRKNKIHHTKGSGLRVYENGQGAIEDNDISFCNTAGVLITTGGNPIIRRNKIHGGKGNGIYVFENGLGLIENNEISEFEKSVIAVSTGGNPTIRGNKILGGKGNGIRVRENGLGLIEKNDISGFGKSGIVIDTGGNPTIRGNKIHDGKGNGIQVFDNGLGIIENNEIFNNSIDGVAVLTNGKPEVISNHVYGNSGSGIAVWSKGAGTYRRNELSQNEAGNWYIGDDSRSYIFREGNQEK